MGGEQMRGRRGAEAAWWFVGAALTWLAALQLARAVRPASAYALAHWLFTYEAGFVRRGLVGSLASPILGAVRPETAARLVDALGLLILVGLLAAVVAYAARAWRECEADWAWAVVPAAFLASPSVLWLCHLIGYFDALLLLLGLAILEALRGRARWWILASLGAVGAATHEVFLVWVLPATFVCALLRASTRWADAGWRSLQPAAALAGGALATFIALALCHADLSLLQSRVFATEVLRASENGAIFYSLTHSSREAYALMASTLWSDPAAQQRLWLDLLAYLPLCALVFADVWPRILAVPMPRSAKHALIGLSLAAAVVPLGLHLIAWDTGRINAYAGDASFLLWLGVRRLRPALDRRRPAQPSAWVFAGVVAMTLGLLATPRLMDGQKVVGHPELWTRLGSAFDRKPRATYRGLGAARPLFDNAGFERGTLEGWTASGDAFARQPTFGDNTVVRGASTAPEGNFWIGTYEDNPKAGRISGEVRGDRALGRLVSQPFTVERPTLAFKLGGGRDPQRLYVAFRVDGVEVARFTGERDEHMRPLTLDVTPYLGRQMQIEIVDASSAGWGHLNVDAFAYVEN